MADVARSIGPLRYLLYRLTCILAFGSFALAQDAPTTCSGCTVSLPTLYRYTWSPVYYEASTTIEITLATLVYVVDPRGETSTSTQHALSTETLNFTTPTTTNVKTLSIGYGDSWDTTETFVVTYPTPFVDYYALYRIQTGEVPTSSVCETFSRETYILPSSHPFYSQASTATLPNATDTLGYDYTLVYDTVPFTNHAALDQPAFTSWYSSVYSDQAAVTDCVANNSYIPPPPTTLTSTSHTTVQTCAAANGTSTCNNTISTATVTYSSATEAAPSASLSALTHTTVAYLTATSTKHISSYLDQSPGNAPPVSTRSRTPTSKSTKAPNKPQSSSKAPDKPQSSSKSRDASRPPDSIPPTSQRQPSSTPGGAGSHPCDNDGDCDSTSPTTLPHSTTLTVTGNTHVTMVVSSIVTRATRGQSITLPTTVVSTITTGGHQGTTHVLSSYETTASGGEAITLTTSQLSTLSGTEGTQTLEVPTSTIVTATSGEVFTLSSSIPTTITSGSQTLTLHVESSTVMTATSDGQLVTVPTSQLSTVTLQPGTYTTDLSGGSTTSSRPSDDSGADSTTGEGTRRKVGRAEAFFALLLGVFSVIFGACLISN